VDDQISVDGLRLGAHFAAPVAAARAAGVVLCHGFPRGPRGATTSAVTYPELADRIARDAGLHALAFNFRGTGRSEGDFSVKGWLADLRGAVDALVERGEVRGVCLVGVSEGGTLAVCAAASDPRVRGVATLAAPVTLRQLGRDPSRALEQARGMGMVKTDGFPADLNAWAREIIAVDAVKAAVSMGDRALLVLHGSDDAVVDPGDARRLVEAAGMNAELRVVFAGGHRLRHDPRAVAALLGWLDRQAIAPPRALTTGE
jgi:uncharacterized protein